jgi:amino ABC transporter, permease protein, 3-TM region, his/glu/gln/arg/opine family
LKQQKNATAQGSGCYGKKKLEETMELSKMLQQLTGGMLITTEIFILTLLFSLPLGLVLSFGRMSKVGVIRFLTKVYISIMRGTPLMLQLIVVYFAPYYVFGLKISQGYRMVAVILAFVLNYAAYFAEIYRSGIESMPVGQYEAAKMLGYSKAQTFLKIILPQVIKRVLPAVTNEMITLVKDTSLAFVLTVTEMFTIAKQIAAAQASVMPLMAAGVFYYIFNLIVAMVMEHVEKRLNYYRG